MYSRAGLLFFCLLSLSSIYLYTLSLRDIKRDIEPAPKMEKPKAKVARYPCSRGVKGRRSIWTSPPVVVTEFKLIFYWNAKSGSTYWKRILQFIQGFKYKFAFIGLKYAKNQNNIVRLLTNDSWIKATFVREPRERILSSYLSIGTDDNHMKCSCRTTVSSFPQFLEVIKRCKDKHWTTQVRTPKEFYKNMMIGKMTDISTFTEQLLRKIGAWNETIESWLKSENTLKLTRSHAKNAKQKLLYYYNNTDLQDLIFDMFADDYEVFNFNKEYF